MPVEILISGIGAVIGAAAIGWLYRQAGFAVWLGAAAGAVAGAVGPLIFMLPVNYCMFNPDGEALYTIEPIDQAFGLGMIVIGMLITVGGLAWITNWWRKRQHKGSASITLAGQTPGSFRSRWLPWVLLAPTLIILALFLYYPSIDTFRLSTLLAKLGARRTAFVCVDNFTTLFTDSGYLNSIFVTIFISVAVVVIGLGLSLLVATMAYQPIAGARIYRTLLIWPYAISPAVAGIIFVLMFNPAGGIINYFLQGIGIAPVGWLNNPIAAPWAVIIASVWKSMGFNILFYIAGLQNVPKDLQESAAIDGANALQRFRHVVFPLLSPITFFLVITNMTYAFFETFATVDFLTGGGPLEATMTLMYRVYEVGVVNNDLGKGAAQSIVLFVMVIALTIFQFRTSESRVTYGA